MQVDPFKWQETLISQEYLTLELEREEENVNILIINN